MANNETDNKPFGAQLQERYWLLRYDTRYTIRTILRAFGVLRSITLRDNLSLIKSDRPILPFLWLYLLISPPLKVSSSYSICRWWRWNTAEPFRFYNRDGCMIRRFHKWTSTVLYIYLVQGTCCGSNGECWNAEKNILSRSACFV
jgi:hypothetical protein